MVGRLVSPVADRSPYAIALSEAGTQMDRHRDVLSDGEQIFRSLVDHSLGLMCVHDLEGNLLFVNSAAAETLGFRPEDGIGWNLRRFLAPAVEGQFDAYLERIRTHGVDNGL